MTNRDTRSASERIFGPHHQPKGQAGEPPDRLPLEEVVERLFGEERRPQHTAEELEEVARILFGARGRRSPGEQE